MTGRVAELAADEGLDFDFDAALTVNTLDAHRLLHLAADLGIGDAAKERLLRAHFTEGADLSDHETLTRLLGEAGADPDRVRAVLAGTEYADAVRADIDEARRLGASGVPFFVIDRRYGISGAQPAETFLQALRTAYAAEDAAAPGNGIGSGRCGLLRSASGPTWRCGCSRAPRSPTAATTWSSAAPATRTTGGGTSCCWPPGPGPAPGTAGWPGSPPNSRWPGTSRSAWTPPQFTQIPQSTQIPQLPATTRTTG